MLRSLSAPQFAEWMAYDQIEPIGDHRTDWQAASICAAVMNARLLGTEAANRFEPKHFLLEWKDPKDKKETKEVTAKPRQTVEQMKFTAMMWVAAMKPKKKRNTP